MQDGHQGGRLPSFARMMWAIWKTRNEQVFRQHRATLQLHKFHIQESVNQRSCFVQDQHEPSRNLFDPSAPPRYHIS